MTFKKPAKIIKIHSKVERFGEKPCLHKMKIVQTPFQKNCIHKVLQASRIKNFFVQKYFHDVASDFLALTINMAIGVVEFSREGYKIRKVFA